MVSLMKKTVGVVGLGRMGSGVAARLHQHNFSVYGYDMYEQQTTPSGVTRVASLEQLLEHTSHILLLVPAGDAVEQVLVSLLYAAATRDRRDIIIIDGGNSLYTDSQTRHAGLKKHNVGFVDAGLSGGVHGLKHGYCVMAGGDDAVVARVAPILTALAAPQGYAHVGPAGAGHYVKTVHNGIEYGLLQAYAEGMHLLKKGAYESLDLAQISKLWEHGSVVRSWLLELLTEVLKDQEKIAQTSGEIRENGTGRWTLQEARKRKVTLPVIEKSLKVRSWSRETGGDYATQLVALLRNAFGGHPVEQKENPDE